MVIGNLNVASLKKGGISKKDINKFFKPNLKNKFYFPTPNYGTRKLIFESMIKDSGGCLSNTFDLNTLAHVTERYPAGSVNFWCVLFIKISFNMQYRKF
jgi:SpoVK/Ycf46/Vps4 family AAA+-type ATPase